MWLIRNPLPNMDRAIRLEQRYRFGQEIGLSRLAYGKTQPTTELHIYLMVVYIYILQYTIIFKNTN
jgi:hypothetical protein